MGALIAKALISGVLIALISEIGKKLPATAALVASLPLVSVLGMILLMRELLRAGVSFWLALVCGCALTVALYLLMMHVGPRLGLRL